MRQTLTVAGMAIGAYFGGPAGAALGAQIGGMVGGYIDPEKVQGPKLGEAPIQTGRTGVPIPVGWGICHTAGNIIQKNAYVEVETEEKAGKGGGPTTIVTRRYRTFAIGMMRSIDGPIAGIRRIWENEKLVYDTRDNPAIPAADTANFAEGLRIYYGDDEQLPDPDLEGETPTTPCYRGLAYVVFVDKDITDFGSAIPNYRFEIQTAADLTITSRPYSVQAIEAIEGEFALESTKQLDKPVEAVLGQFAVTSFSLAAQRVYYDVPEEAFIGEFAVTDITLKEIRTDYDVGSEAFIGQFAVTDITLDPIRVTYAVPEEAILGEFAVTEITLS